MESAAGYRSIDDAYAEGGPTEYYRRFGHVYRNPHEPVLRDLIKTVARKWPLDRGRVLDLAAGSGEVTLALQDIGGWERIDAVDLYTCEAFRNRTGRSCEAISFEQIADGVMSDRRYGLIVCSFAMHLLTPSRLPALCTTLSQMADQLLILSPHKRPKIRPSWGWKLTNEMVLERVHARLYGS